MSRLTLKCVIRKKVPVGVVVIVAATSYTFIMIIHCYLPTHLDIGKTKKINYPINMNHYRNAHYQQNNKAKKLAQDIVSKQLKEYRFSKFKKVKLYLTVYKGSKRKIDRSNVLSIAEKFICDALTGMQIIPDDNDDYIESTHYYSGYDKTDPRIECEIHVIE